MSIPPVMSVYRTVGIYAVVLLAFSTVTLTYEWADPIDTPEGPWEYYREIGLRRGVVVAAGHAAPGGGWRTGVSWPRFMRMPVHVGAGPESGGLYAAPWFVLGSIAALHLVVRAIWPAREKDPA